MVGVVVTNDCPVEDFLDLVPWLTKDTRKEVMDGYNDDTIETVVCGYSSSGGDVYCLPKADYQKATTEPDGETELSVAFGTMATCLPAIWYRQEMITVMNTLPDDAPGKLSADKIADIGQMAPHFTAVTIRALLGQEPACTSQNIKRIRLMCFDTSGLNRARGRLGVSELYIYGEL